MVLPIIDDVTRRKLILTMLAMMIVDLSIKVRKLGQAIEKSKRHERKVDLLNYQRRRDNITLDSVTEVLTSRNFQNTYRMSRSTFQKLLFLVEPDMQRNEAMGRLAKRPIVTPEIRLAICLRVMAGGKKQDIATTYKVSPDTVYPIFHDARAALNKRLKFPGIPLSFVGLKRMADDFQRSREPANPLPGFIGALDGISVKLRCPSKDDLPASYFCRKGYHSLPVQAMCDSNYRFLCYSAKCRGSTHDSLAHAVSALGKYLEEGRLSIEFWISCDEAYMNSLFLITPVPGTQATDEEDSFNFLQSSLRMHIEQAFGMLVRKWEILKNLQFNVQRSAEIVGLAMKLHNFVIDHCEKTAIYPTRTEEQRRGVEESEK